MKKSKSRIKSKQSKRKIIIAVFEKLPGVFSIRSISVFQWTFGKHDAIIKAIIGEASEIWFIVK